MNATPRYFRDLRSPNAARQINYGNTVLVQRDNAEWWLGYVQDIDDDYFFIDFDAHTVAAKWIHSSRIWPHRFYHPKRTNGSVGGSASVQVALRDGDDGPLVFRRAHNVESVGRMFYSVRPYNQQPPEEAARCIVHASQFVAKLPAEETESFFTRRCGNCGITYRKHVIRFEAAHRLRGVDFMPKFLSHSCRLTLVSGDPCDASCQFHMRQYGVDSPDTCVVFCAEKDHTKTAPYSFNVGCRVFVRAGMDTVMFLCAEVHGDAAGRSMFWNEDALKEACQNYLHEQEAREAGNLMKEACINGAIQYDNGEVRISDLPQPVMASILLNLDRVMQFRTRRVCMLWTLLLDEYASSQNIILDLRRLHAREPYNTEFPIKRYRCEYELVTLLDRAISRETRTVALLESGRASDRYTRCLSGRFSMLRAVLRAKNIRVQTIIAKDGCDYYCAPIIAFLGLRPKSNNDFTSYRCHTLGYLWALCNALILVNYSASHPADNTVLLLELFENAHVWLRDVNFGGSRQCSELGVDIPYLHFRSTDTADEQSRRLMTAVNDNCPAVTPEVYAKVTAMHAHWRETLAYPDAPEWGAVRAFCKLFSSFGPDHTSSWWDGADLRELDVSALSRCALHFLDGFSN
ncbi:uncharacterized protein LOC129585368 [Paramacrobiotus metropolitanus]|uniref:uncharacterized protein LOC129585368 n=1 Tax=Paramacrobiotus metropolitanus TaxID=2943436 RepID=UPI002445EE41|nr:uncharacterized protein LOC129585368 [Paramacrobiotus metropolitanus]